MKQRGSGKNAIEANEKKTKSVLAQHGATFRLMDFLIGSSNQEKPHNFVSKRTEGTGNEELISKIKMKIQNQFEKKPEK